MNNRELLTKAAITSGSFTGGIGLSVEEADRFIDYMVDESTLMKNARVERMASATKKIYKLGIGSEVLVPASPVVDPGETVSINTAQIILTSKEMIAIARISDDSIEDNIEGDAFVDHLMRMIASAGANQLEYAYLMGKVVSPATKVSELFSGWYERIKAGGNVLDATADTDRYISRAKFSKLLKKIPLKYRGVNKRNLRYIVASDIEMDYGDILAEKTGVLATQFRMGELAGLAYNSVPIVPVPLLPTNLPEKEVAPVNDATFMLLTDLNNLIIGIQRDIKVETQREARLRATDFVMTLRADIQLENPEAAAIYEKLKVKE